MKLNVFSVAKDNIQPMLEKFEAVGLSPIHSAEQTGWTSTFFFSAEEEPNAIPWVGTFAEFFGEPTPQNLIYFAAYVFRRDDRCFVFTYGKSHFYVRPFCEHDFGIEVAKRIANESDIRQTSSKKFAGKKKKEIKSYTSNTALDVESGESIDYLQAAIIIQHREEFGRSAKFGGSVLLNAPVEKDKIGDLLDDLEALLVQAPRFALPRTTVITEETQITQFDARLIEAIMADHEATDFTHSGYDVVGVDFVFSGNERYTLSCRGYGKRSLQDQELGLDALRSYVEDEGIPEVSIFDIRVQVENEGQKTYSKPLKEALDFIVDGENVMLSQGRWVRFNEDYVDQLNTYIDNISLAQVEQEFEQVSDTETDFNVSKAVLTRGYVSADKDFSKIKTSTSTPIEAWDLRKDDTVYAVKFGTAQKVGYVCDQAMAVLEILRNNANVRKLDKTWKIYCLWFGFKLAKLPDKVSDINSIILKQKIEAWARRCRELGIEPQIKLSLKTN